MLKTIKSFEDRHRLPWLVGGVVIAGIVLLVPLIATPISPEPPPIAIAQILVAGVVLGVARQGVDILGLRLFASSLAILMAIALTESPAHPLTCSGPVNCVQLSILAALFFGFFGGLVLGIVAVPTAALWGSGPRSLRPELAWPRLRWWQWLVIVLIGTPILGLLLGIPWSG